jgi:hypothetical protein
MCIRQSGPFGVGDTLLEPTTDDEIGERIDTVAIVECDASGRFYLRVVRPLGMQHSEEALVPVPRGLYRMRSDRNWPGAFLPNLKDGEGCGRE